MYVYDYGLRSYVSVLISLLRFLEIRQIWYLRQERLNLVENGILKTKNHTSFRLLNLRFHHTNFLTVYLCQLEKEKVQMSPRHSFVLQPQTCRICDDVFCLKSK